MYTRHIVPSVYELALTTNLDSLTTDGSLILRANYDETQDRFGSYSSKIVLNSRGIQINEDSVTVTDGLE